MKSTRGKGGGTFAHWQIALAGDTLRLPLGLLWVTVGFAVTRGPRVIHASVTAP
jgi:hypothetical protein